MKLTIRNDEDDREALATNLVAIGDQIRDGYTSGKIERMVWVLSGLIIPEQADY